MRWILVLMSLFWILPLSSAEARIPRSRHVVVVVEENHGFDAAMAEMPFLKSLGTRYGIAAAFYANTHPSIGNYFLMTLGRKITDDDEYSATIDADNLVRQLVAAGRTWKSYTEDLPQPGYFGPDKYPYVRHHVPLAYFKDVRESAEQRARLVPFTQFEEDARRGTLPEFSFIVPNQLHNAHDGTTAEADAWLKLHLEAFLASDAFKKDGLLIITFDEASDEDSAKGGGRILTVVAGPTVIPGAVSQKVYQHESLLRTVEEALELPPLAAVKAVESMADLFRAEAAPRR